MRRNDVAAAAAASSERAVRGRGTGVKKKSPGGGFSVRCTGEGGDPLSRPSFCHSQSSSRNRNDTGQTGRRHRRCRHPTKAVNPPPLPGADAAARGHRRRLHERARSSRSLVCRGDSTNWRSTAVPPPAPAGEVFHPNGSWARARGLPLRTSREASCFR